MTLLCWTLSKSMDCSHQAPLFMGFSRQEYWSGFSCPSPGDLPNLVSSLDLLHCRQVLYHLSYQEDQKNKLTLLIEGSGDARDWTWGLIHVKHMFYLWAASQPYSWLLPQKHFFHSFLSWLKLATYSLPEETLLLRMSTSHIFKGQNFADTYEKHRL